MSQSGPDPDELPMLEAGDTSKDRAFSARGFLTTQVVRRGSASSLGGDISARRYSGAYSRSPATVWKRSASTLLLVLLLK